MKYKTELRRCRDGRIRPRVIPASVPELLLRTNKVQRGFDSPCWEWIGSTSPKGYPVFSISGKTLQVHRAVWEHANGIIPKGLCACHRCDNPLCINPNHIFIGTRADNNFDRDSKGRHVALRGESHGMHRLTEEQIKEIRLLASQGIPHTHLERKFDLSGGHVGQIVHRKIWRHV